MFKYDVKSHNILESSKPLAFADDTKLLLCKCMLQADLNRVVNWYLDNNMVLHQD